MFSVEYSSKYHAQILAIPCENEEKANEVYNIIKNNMGEDVYQLNKLGKGTTVEVVTGCGIKTIDTSVVASVWIANLDNELAKQWREKVYAMDKRYK